MVFPRHTFSAAICARSAGARLTRLTRPGSWLVVARFRVSRPFLATDSAWRYHICHAWQAHGQPCPFAPDHWRQSRSTHPSAAAQVFAALLAQEQAVWGAAVVVSACLALVQALVQALVPVRVGVGPPHAQHQAAATPTASCSCTPSGGPRVAGRAPRVYSSTTPAWAPRCSRSAPRRRQTSGRRRRCATERWVRGAGRL